ncbi:alpha-(1,3)-fucosyltransferase 10-like isoform X1 [Dreissena polymorpha]|nr:alpha-(1,3)-fucosyltransferase 10-like isoform X1 [Dreissena polymorpha]XP_052235422.1 alpha-(1,3)-fucosyltransferase 10-like isoform X1 [Dreissena polymorpha]XP_052235423.1 alpha-(1,3)-fucosyltransferase 10-like isoform X1 [Dreissena polymorpha]XP_052235424.1 alpha-(1,3)-fucosyltransferase 10-like isoform X1 [Dreissena polymorpha]XP_052235425.1 alpha-(1,3)-fucosyltransferase 10-like isoform X1 [Dreissena polymorpha]XP_052235427.1 alpha-(1,3)-fucosyltransferase 10-like isoform X1 [Dreissena
MAGRKNRQSEMKVDPFRMFLYVCLIGFITLMLVGYTMLKEDKYAEVDAELPAFKDLHSNENAALREDIREPLILWWTPFTKERGAYRKCGDVSCYFTEDRHYWQHTNTKVVMFYGTSLKVYDLPLPRQPTQEWALLHEESPKNNFLLHMPLFISLFNHTATFKREADFPLTFQHLVDLRWLEGTKYLVSTDEKNRLQRDQGLAMISYTQSDQNVPTNRDGYVSALMKEIVIDSYGTCLHNKDLPEHVKDPVIGMEHEDFYRLQAQYKFSLAMENYVCDDYVTEKVWRPLMLGTVPVIHGSPRIKDILPDNHSAIIIEDFKSAKELANYLKFLNKNDEQYNKFFNWKKTGVTNPYLKAQMLKRSWSVQETWKNERTNFIEDFECFVCKRLHENIKLEKAGKAQKPRIVEGSHTSCPKPAPFFGNHNSWTSQWDHTENVAEAVRYYAEKNVQFSKGDLHAKVSELAYKKKSWF